MLEPGSDEFAAHPKVLDAGTLAAGLYARLVGYCRAHNTGGYVAPHVPAFLTSSDRAALERLGLVAPPDLVGRLLADLERVELLDTERPPGTSPAVAPASQTVPGWYIAGWSDGLSSSEKTRARKARYRERKRAGSASPSVPEASPGDVSERPSGDVPGACPVLSPLPHPSPPSHTLPSDSPSLSLSLGSTQTPADAHAHACVTKPASEPSPEPEPDVEEPEHGTPEARRQRYAKAYAKGISSVTGRPFALDPATGKALRLEALDAWLRDKAAAFARASQGDEARFSGSLNPAAFARYLRAPDAPTSSSSSTPRGRPEDMHRQRGWSQTPDERERQWEAQLQIRLKRVPEAQRQAEEQRIRALHAQTLETERLRAEQRGATA